MKNSKQELINLWLWVNKINRNNHEKGNTLILAMGIGLVLVIITSMTLMNSSKDKTNTTAGEFTKQTVAIAEGGVENVKNQLSTKYPDLLRVNYNPTSPTSGNDWSDPPTSNGISPCAKSISDGGSIDLPNLIEGSVGSGNYVVKSYNYDSASQVGTLALQGTRNDSLQSQAQLQVALNIGIKTPPQSFPGIYGETVINIGNNDFLDPDKTNDTTFNIICSDCVAKSSVSLNCTADGEPSQAYLEDAMGVGSGTVEGKMIIGSPKLPDFPPPPSNACSISQKPDCFILINDIDADIKLPRQEDIDNRNTWIADSSSDWYNDTSLKSKPYKYIVQRNGKVSIKKGNIVVNSYTAPVQLYVTGTAQMLGSIDHIHSNATDPTTDPNRYVNATLDRLAIFGCHETFDSVLTSNGITNCISPYTDQEIKLNGQSTAVNVFIYAPYATVGVNGGGDFTAVIWSYAWDMSSGNGASVTVPDDAQTLLGSLFDAGVLADSGIQLNSINSTGSFKRIQASN